MSKTLNENFVRKMMKLANLPSTTSEAFIKEATSCDSKDDDEEMMKEEDDLSMPEDDETMGVEDEMDMGADDEMGGDLDPDMEMGDDMEEGGESVSVDAQSFIDDLADVLSQHLPGMSVTADFSDNMMDDEMGGDLDMEPEGDMGGGEEMDMLSDEPPAEDGDMMPDDEEDEDLRMRENKQYVRNLVESIFRKVINKK